MLFEFDGVNIHDPSMPLSTGDEWRALAPASETYLQKRLQLPGQVAPMDIASKLADEMVQATKATRQQQLEAIALAYAARAAMQLDEHYRHALVQLARRLNVRLQKNTDPLRILLRGVINYGEDKAGSARRLYSRDVAALKYLASEGVSPLELIKRADGTGEGLDQWSRRWVAKKREHEGGDQVNTQQIPEIDRSLLPCQAVIRYMAANESIIENSFQVDDPEFGTALARLLKKFGAKSIDCGAPTAAEKRGPTEPPKINQEDLPIKIEGKSFFAYNTKSRKPFKIEHKKPPKRLTYNGKKL